MNRSGIILALLLLAGCALPLAPLEEDVGGGESQLYHIRLSRWSKQKFSGLVVVQRTVAGLHYALLDGTGVTLLSARVDGSGQHSLLTAYGPFQDSSVPAVLSLAMFRVFLAQPTQQPCSRNFFIRFCEYDQGDTISKKATMGLATMWQVEYDQVQWRLAHYRSPWIGFELELSTLH